MKSEDEKTWLKTKDGQEYFIYKTEKCDMQKELTETINKLQNNWNELKKWVIEQEQKAWDEVSSTFGYVLNKMQELEGSDSNE